jgi:hypothetical protein
VQELRIECFFPADAGTPQVFRDWAAHAPREPGSARECCAARLAPVPTRPPTAARAPCTFLHRSLMHARPASLDRLRVFPARELRPSPGSAIFSLRDANARTHGVMAGAHRLGDACHVVWTEKRQGRATMRQGCADDRAAQPPRWPPHGPRRHHAGCTRRQAPGPPATPKPPAPPRVGPVR